MSKLIFIALCIIFACSNAANARQLKDTGLKTMFLTQEASSQLNQIVQKANSNLKDAAQNAVGNFSSMHSLMPTLPSKFDFKFKGDGTAFSENINNTGSNFACSYRYVNDRFSVFFGAINQKQWGNGNSCGKCAVARCVHPMCTRREPIMVQILDLCPECKEGDLDFGFEAYKELTGLWPHRLTIEWDWADCGENIDGSIQYDPKDGITKFWQAFYLSNTKYPIVNATLNGTPLQRSPYNFWIHPAMMPEGGATLQLVADNGKTVNATINDVTKKADLKIQFP